MKKILLFALIISLVLLSTGCQKKEYQKPTEELPSPIVTIEMEDGNKISLELYPNVAPLAVTNFVSLIQSGFYDGNKIMFHRIIPGFMIQGGDPTNTGTGGSEHKIMGEFSQNGIENDISHQRGVLSMARSQDLNSASSQFFIMQADNPSLDGLYTAFGRVTDDSSMAVVDKIASIATDSSDRPLLNYMIKSITVDTQGYVYTLDAKNKSYSIQKDPNLS